MIKRISPQKFMKKEVCCYKKKMSDGFVYIIQDKLLGWLHSDSGKDVTIWTAEIKWDACILTYIWLTQT